MSHPKTRLGGKKGDWVDPSSLPNAGSISGIGGNAPANVKQLCLNTFFAYGVGDSKDTFGYAAGRAVQFTSIDVDYKHEGTDAVKSTTVAEVVVDKCMANGNGMMHGGCMAYLIDNCCSTPLVVLGLLSEKNGVGVTQALNLVFHAPVPVGACIRITSTSIALGKRTMTARCEITDRDSGKVVASALLNKMQPKL